MQKYILAILSFVLFTQTVQASRYAGGREWNAASRHWTPILGCSPHPEALHMICDEATYPMTTLQQHYALVLQPRSRFVNLMDAFNKALAWAADPAFAADPKGYAARKIAEEDPVAMAAKAAEAARIAEQERLAAEQQERERQAAEAEVARVAAEAEAARILEQEREAAAAEAARLAAEAEAASASTADGSSTQGGDSDHESSRAGSGSPLSTAGTFSPEISKLSIRAPGQTGEDYAKTTTPESTPLRPTRSGVETPSILKADGTRLTGPSRFAVAAAGAKPKWNAIRSSSAAGAQTCEPHDESAIPSKAHRPVDPEAALTEQILSALLSSGIPREIATTRAAIVAREAFIAAQAALGGHGPMSAAGAGASPADFAPGLAGLSALPAAAAASTGEDPTPTDFLATSAGLSPTGPSGRILPLDDLNGLG